MEINIKDYLSEKEIKDICESEVRLQVARQMYDESQIERILTNTAYDLVIKAVDEQFNGNTIEFLKNKVADRISNLSEYVVFHGGNRYSYENSKGYEILQDVSAESKPLIEKRVAEIIDKYDFSSIEDRIEDVLYDIIHEKLFKRED